MTQVVATKPYTIENSVQLTRPDFKSYLRPDTNVGSTDITTYNEIKRVGDLHIPNKTGPLDYQVKCCDNNKLNLNHYLKANIVKNKGALIYDPLSNFVSPAGEILLNSGRSIPSLGKMRKEPQTTVPQNVNSIRTHENAVDEIKRTKEGDNSSPELNWNSKKVTDIVQRARLGGWTSSSSSNLRELTPSSSYRLHDIFPNMKVTINDTKERDELAKNYRFKTSIQQMYEQVNWDAKLPKKLHAPVTSYEAGKADPLKIEQTQPNRPHIWQSSVGSTWDRLQARSNQFSRQEIQFTDPNKPCNHIPGYTGHVGGRNHLYRDEVTEKFQPLTSLRTQQPKEQEANYKPNIPGYTGRTHSFKTTSVSHYDLQGRPYTTTAAFHRQIPNIPNSNTDPKSLSGDFAQIQTKVPPQNPFDNVTRATDNEINNSIDHVKYPMQMQKNPTHQDYLLGSKEQRLKSILKKNLS